MSFICLPELYHKNLKYLREFFLQVYFGLLAQGSVT